MINGENEEILGIFPGMLDKSGKILRKVWTCKLVFTTSRLVAIYEKRFGGGALLRDPYYISFNAGARDRLKMKEIYVENLLKENEENFEIPYSEIAAIEMKFIANYRNLQIFSQEDLDTPKYTFGVAIRERYNDVFDEFLQKVVPDKV